MDRMDSDDDNSLIYIEFLDFLRLLDSNRYIHVKGQLWCLHFFPYFSPQLFPYFSIYYSVQLAYIIWHIIVYMYRARIMQEFICFYLLLFAFHV